MAATYRPVGVTLGVVALWAGLITGVTASLGRPLGSGAIWWPIHKVAAVVFALVWAHGFWTGIDTPRPGLVLPGDREHACPRRSQPLSREDASDRLDELVARAVRA